MMRKTVALRRGPWSLAGRKEEIIAGRSTFWSTRIDTAVDAKKMIRNVDAARSAGLGFWLHRSHSRVAATLLLVLAAVSIVVTVMDKFGGGQGGRNIGLAAIIL